MVEFPETAEREWNIIADAANADLALRQRLERDTQVERELEKLRIRHQAALMFQAEVEAEDTPDLDMVSLADYRANPVANGVTDLISGVLNDEGVCLILGPSGAGKSTLGLQMMYSLATGTEWLGQSVVQMHGGFGIMSYDMPGNMMLDWMNGFPNVDPNRFSLVNAHKRGNPLAVPAQRSAIAKHWKARNVEVIMVDSFSASFFGHDQNDAGAAMAHYRDLKKFALTECGAKVLMVIVHSTEANPMKARGSTVHHDVGDSIVSVAEDKQVSSATFGSRHVRMVKYRQARGQTQMNPVVLTAPDATTHLVDLDIGAMTLAGYSLPVGSVAAAAAFPALPDQINEPDTDSDSPLEGDDDL